jgi:hypothetical protein
MDLLIKPGAVVIKWLYIIIFTVDLLIKPGAVANKWLAFTIGNAGTKIL